MTSAARVPALMISLDLGRGAGRPASRLAEQELAEADDPGHHVVDLVGHAARQAAGRLHPLRPPELLLDPLPLGDVAVDAAEQRRAAVARRCS